MPAFNFHDCVPFMVRPNRVNQHLTMGFGM